MRSLDFLRVWHRSFALHLEFAVEGGDDINSAGLDPETVGNDTLCQLGHWISTKRNVLSASPAFAELVRAHKEFHRAAGQLVIFCQAGDLVSARGPCFGEFQAASAAVGAAIGAVEEEGHAGLDGAAPSCEYGDENSLWNESLRIGVPAIDEQQKAIAHLADRMLRSPEMRLASEAGLDLLTAFQRLVRLRFDTEKLLVGRLSLPDAVREARLVAREEILEKIAAIFYEMCTDNGPRCVFEIEHEIRTIVVDRIIDLDMSLNSAPPSSGELAPSSRSRDA